MACGPGFDAAQTRGADELPGKIYEQLVGAVEGVLVQPTSRPAAWHRLLPKTALQPLGYAEHEALLPSGARTFQGYRLLQEYFAFAQRFLFVELSGLKAASAACLDNELEIIVLLARGERAFREAYLEDGDGDG